uniref:Trophoblast glycoprotein-like n=1 Tax=Pundamilia nyererei TaxID=303518 RepID=A0A3B4F9Q8_9CICH
MCFSAVFVFLGILFCALCRCLECPFGCECFAVIRTVKCVSKDLLTAPENIPGYARTVIITGNNIHQIGPSSFTELENVTNIILTNNSRLLRLTEMASHTFSSLVNLRFLDLSGNQLALIHPEALSIPGSPLQELNLSQSLYNFTALTDLTTALRWGGLAGLLRLDLSGNKLALLPPGIGTFSGMNYLEMLDLTHNTFSTFGTDALVELDKLGDIRILLGNNPYTCSCEINEFVAWLNKSRAKVDVDAVRCASPVLAEVADLTLQTSYVFLGLVLGLVGMVFLFVLYLNRKGMKKWINEMRDACRDVLEGYYYRYEIDSDPRLGHISADSRRAQRQLGISLPQQLPSDTSVAPTKTQVKQLTPPLNL